MVTDGKFFIDGKAFPFEHSEEKVSSLLHLVRTSSDESLLVSPTGHVYSDPDSIVAVAPGDHFKTEKRNGEHKPLDKPIHFKVNGELSSTVENPLSVEAILRSAGPGAAIDLDDLNNYFLENTLDGRKYEDLKDLVTISEGDNFLAIHVGSTPVAQL